ncbi:MAG: hypothetical protein ACOZAJ_02505, partial [Patescibacteria group bacterium]
MKIVFFAISFVLAWLFTWLVKKIAWRFSIVDQPDGFRKVHNSPTPLLGGVAIWLTSSLLVIYLAFFTNLLIGRDISVRQIIGLLIAGSILMLSGYLDDKYKIKPSQQIISPIIAVVVIILGGINVSSITNPLGGIINLNAIWPYLGTVITFGWLLGIMYTTKLLDGLDGLATGVGLIGSLIIFGLTQVTAFYQPSV